MIRKFLILVSFLILAGCNKTQLTGGGVGTGESIGGGGGYEATVTRLRKEADLALALISQGANDTLCKNVSGLSIPQAEEVKSLLRENADKMRVALEAVKKVSVTKNPLSMNDAKGIAHPSHALYNADGTILLSQSDVDDSKGLQLLIHEAFHASGSFPDFVATTNYPQEDGAQRRMDDAGRCAAAFLADNYPYAAATDTTFNRTGLAVFPGETAKTAVQSKDGGIIFVTSVPLTADYALYKQKSRIRKIRLDGSLDPDFGTVTIEPLGGTVGGWPIASSVVEGDDGSVTVVGGRMSDTTYNRLFAYRVSKYGVPDTTFNNRVEADALIFTAYTGFTTVLQEGEKLVAGGYYAVTNTDSMYMAIRFNADGTRDASFNRPDGHGHNFPGVVLLDLGDEAIGFSIVATPEKGYLFGGQLAPEYGKYPSTMGLVRLTGSGSIDTSFGPNGTGGLVVSFGSNNSHTVVSMTYTPAGKIVVIGYAAQNDAKGMCAILRLNGDGRFDNSFGNGGKVTVQYPGLGAQGRGVFLQGDGKIVGSGVFHDGTGSQGAIFRLNEDGEQDKTFKRADQTATIKLLPAPNTDLQRVIRMKDGRFIAIGDSEGQSGASTRSAFVMRLYGESGF